ncbi:hypothetical protein [Streptomyces sp. NPDC029041]|uniref:hypothetical protein n=1 Tax=Streptomyces sp. NPDC029041 TaxID=3155727 RepID=UPI0033DAFB4D
MTLQLALLAVPFVLGLLIRLARRPQHALAGLGRSLRDLITLRMVLRDTAPDERAELIEAHRAWRTERPAGKAGEQRNTTERARRRAARSRKD